MRYLPVALAVLLAGCSTDAPNTFEGARALLERETPPGIEVTAIAGAVDWNGILKEGRKWICTYTLDEVGYVALISDEGDVETAPRETMFRGEIPDCSNRQVKNMMHAMRRYITELPGYSPRDDVRFDVSSPISIIDQFPGTATATIVVASRWFLTLDIETAELLETFDVGDLFR